ncbi:MAG: hypothetical protein A2600_12695 [Candidatus Lambdaproteobacteria bacterium RIFOXYD1_FULL_56_27]|uniref:Uncharacterized protein n=1 Tax=Candidatus Lambdaproteobacteria bacterium RIFOXYD2_FULL_56_26 TaxID=1817773 RepID=A0A1F6GU99_9PROT|nr:MAG: hypothetical protein A2426_06585 [Candidatus Lambdaproteobacteria bacterium RIFOXYC1_FULL_56_13]OGH01571.1 MAG: hypothetical protein A2557_04020 [Candidatus Lambdaproteobacteria bacterium RIFOXYD2_FULL_56_26]OGH07180.1 MAG: hypothetical protein A2600_12695 [Candidatus Lambdaproteobacteria bacterium RIFOXYD1_FULL_56_27]
MPLPLTQGWARALVLGLGERLLERLNLGGSALSFGAGSPPKGVALSPVGGPDFPVFASNQPAVIQKASRGSSPFLCPSGF